MLTGGLAWAQTGLISTHAGTGSSGPFIDGVTATSATLFGPAGLAVDSNGNLFIADTNNSRIRKVSGGIMTTVAGGGARAAPRGVANPRPTLKTFEWRRRCAGRL